MSQAAAIDDPFLSGFVSGWLPDPTFTVSEWADEHRVLSRVSSAEPGQWRTSRVPYMRQIMDDLSEESPIEIVAFMKGAQIAATEAGNNWIGYVIDAAPAPTLVVYPTLSLAKRWSRTRIAPMIRDTPILRGRVSAERSRDAQNSTLEKEFDGGSLLMAGANSAAGLRSQAVKNLFLDEVDAYPGDIDDEGDPVELALARTSTFARRKVFMPSTPTVHLASRIEAEYLASDRRRYFVPCPSCSWYDFLSWTGTDWFNSTTGRHHRVAWEDDKPETAHFRCGKCDAAIPEGSKTWMFANGQWRATAPQTDPVVVGYHLSALYSPLGWKSLEACVRQFLRAKRTHDSERLKTFVNTVLGETWEERGESVDPDTLMGRREIYEAEVPAGVGILVAAVDVQGDRLEVKVKGYGAGEESWLVAYHVIEGDPGVIVPDRDGVPSVWVRLEEFRRQTWTLESGRTIRLECMVIDSGGHHADEVYRYAKQNAGRGVYAIRGGNVRGAEIVGKPSRKNRLKIKLFTLGVDAAKDRLASRMRINRPGPGYMHFPEWADTDYFDQLTAERKLPKKVKPGRPTLRVWTKIRERNEAWDLEVYALAALYIALGPRPVGLTERATRNVRALPRPAADASKPDFAEDALAVAETAGKLARFLERVRRPAETLEEPVKKAAKRPVRRPGSPWLKKF